MFSDEVRPLERLAGVRRHVVVPAVGARVTETAHVDIATLQADER